MVRDDAPTGIVQLVNERLVHGIKHDPFIPTRGRRPFQHCREEYRTRRYARIV